MKLQAQVQLRRRDFVLDVDVLIEDPVTLIVGPSGAGKTTLLDIIAGVVRASAGVVRFDSELLDDVASRHHTPIEARRFGYVFQEDLLFPHMTVEANLAYGASDDAELERVVDRLRLHKLRARSPDQLSGGERRRVAIGRALASHPRLLLLDEPFTGQNTELRTELARTLLEIARIDHVPIICVTHDDAIAVDIGVRRIRIDGGRVVSATRD